MDRAKQKEYGSKVSEYHALYPGQDKILSVLEAEHFMHGRVNEARYHFDVDAPDGLFASIHENGVEQPGMIWWNEGRGHIISGTRRWIRLLASNILRAENGLPARSMKFEINGRWTKTDAIQKYKRANQHQLKNDALTNLEAAALEVEQGVALDEAAETWEIPARVIRNAELILKAAPELKQALALGEIKLGAALKLVCQHRTHEAQAAALAVPKAAAPKRKYLGEEARSKLRRMLVDHLAGKPINLEELAQITPLI